MAGDWSNKRVEIAYPEVRTVIQSQREVISDIDDKAIRTVRLNAIIVGVIVAAAQIAGATLFHPDFLNAGIVFLVISLGLGMITYSESNLYLGPNKEYIIQLKEGSFEGGDWEADLLERMADWMDANHEDVTWNGKILFATQVSLFLGIIGIALSVAF